MIGTVVKRTAAVATVVGAIVVAAPSAAQTPPAGPAAPLAEGELPPAPQQPGAARELTFATTAGAAAAHGTVVRAYTATFGVSEREAERRLELLRAGRHLTSRLRDAFGRGFSQASFDNDSGRWVVAIGPRGDARAVRATLDELGLATTRIERAELDHVALADRVAALSRRLEAVVGDGHATIGQAADGVRITVARDAPAAQRRLIADAAAAHDATVERSRDDDLRVQPAQCNGGHMDGATPARFCDALRGGSRYYTANAPGSTSCSLGFWAGAPGASWSSTFFLTAGHCQQPPMGRTWSSCTSGRICGPAGWQAAMRYDDGGGDSGALYVSDYRWPRQPGWTDWRTGARYAIRYYDSAPVGTPICHGGATTGLSCGIVDGTNMTIRYDATALHGPRTLAGMGSAVGVCVQRGDSGGPVFNHDLQGAVGITSGGACIAGREYGYNLVFEPLQRIVDTYGIYPYGG